MFKFFKLSTNSTDTILVWYVEPKDEIGKSKNVFYDLIL